MDKFEMLSRQVTPILKPYVRRISVFGSYARGEEKPESDIDILIQLKPSDQRPPLGLKFFGLQTELGRLLGHEVDLVTEEGLSPYIRPYIEKEKVILYEER
ncbi:MAG: nucleotidyltransferase family protein [Chloroflexota bacterium]